jgi:hypothetical protein
LLYLTQAHTFGPLVPGDDAGTLTIEQNLAHLDEIGEVLSWHVHALAREAEPKLYALLDTLHLTHCHRPGVLGFDDVRALDERLAALGARLLLLRAEPQTLWERCLVARRGSDFLRYARRFGQTEAQIHAWFLQEQDQILRLAQRSAMPGLQLEVEDPELEGAAWAWWTGS